MSDDEERTSGAPESTEVPKAPTPDEGAKDERAKTESIIRLAVPPWMVVFNVGGTMLCVRMMMTTSYVERWHLETYAALAAALFGIVTAIKIVLLTKRDDRMPSRGRVVKQLAIIAGIAGFPTLLPAQGCLALVNRVGRLDDVTVLRCKAERIEARVRLQGRRNVVFYACAAPDGTMLRGRADEAFSVDPGGAITIPAARGRLGAWIRLGPPEPVRP